MKSDDRLEAQWEVCRHILDFMDRNGRAHRSRKGKNGALVQGMRRIEAELRREFWFRERRCGVCGWKPPSEFHKHPSGRAGLQSICILCAKLRRGLPTQALKHEPVELVVRSSGKSVNGGSFNHPLTAPVADADQSRRRAR